MIQELMERRKLKLLWIPEEDILRMFDRVKPYDWLRRPFFALPEGTTVVKSIHSPDRMAFGFLLHNPLWEAVHLSEIPPELPYIQIALEMPKFCDFCGKAVPINQFCICKVPDEKTLRSTLTTDYVSEFNIVNSKNCKKLCPRCKIEIDYNIYDCPNCRHDFN